MRACRLNQSLPLNDRPCRTKRGQALGPSPFGLVLLFVAKLAACLIPSYRLAALDPLNALP